ncbi:MAG: helix-turn-helix transcriptional regulator [Halorientalis sp.]
MESAGSFFYQMARPLSLALVCLLLVGAVLGQGPVVAAGGGVTTHADSTAAQGDGSQALATPQRFESTQFIVTVYANGSAQWTFKHFTGLLENSTERETFREYAETFETQETELWTNFRNSAQALTDAGSAATGRNMTARNFHRTAGLNPQGNTGVVEMSFLWTNFTQASGDRVVVGDVFQGEFYVGESQRLVFRAGPNLTLLPDEASPPPDSTTDSSVGWTGPQTFTDGNPRVVFTTTATGSGGGGATTTPETGRATPGGFLPTVLVGALIVAIGVGAAIAWRTGLFGSTTESDDTDGPTAGTTAESESGDAAADPEPESAVADEELLTDEDRVISLLEDNGGRMKQATIVDETDWSKSKVSMLLSDMEEEERISKLRVGRENIISLKGHEPDAAGSPFDDE